MGGPSFWSRALRAGRVWYWTLHYRVRRAFANRLRICDGSCTMTSVDDIDIITPDRLVVVPAKALDDILELSRLALQHVDDDVLAGALRGAIANVRLSQLMEP